MWVVWDAWVHGCGPCHTLAAESPHRPAPCTTPQTTHETTKSQLGSATALNAALQETIRGWVAGAACQAAGSWRLAAAGSTGALVCTGCQLLITVQVGCAA